MDSVLEALEGQIVFLRPRKRVLFFDIIVCGGQTRVEIAVTRGGGESKGNHFHLGDEIHCMGNWEEETFRAVQCTILKAWDHRIAGFTPLPPPSRRQVDATLHCKSWLNSKRCLREGCCYLHAPIESTEYKLALKVFLCQLEEKRKGVVLAADPFKGAKLRKSKMEHVFAQWLVRTFQLGPDSFVLDVAGGAGKLARELLLAGVGKVVIVDPRTDHRESCAGIEQVVGYFDMEFQLDHGKRHPDLLIGLHPDQATDACIQWSLKNRVAFAVVPCCVFADLNEGRKLSSGSPVRTYEDLIQYLTTTLCSNVYKMDFLPVQGRNCIIYQLAHAE